VLLALEALKKKTRARRLRRSGSRNAGFRIGAGVGGRGVGLATIAAAVGIPSVISCKRYGRREDGVSDRDFLDEIVDERTERNPAFPSLVGAAERRRRLLRALAHEREQLQLSQTAVAAAMRTSQSAVARLEKSATDTKLSTVDRFAAALGYRLEYRLVRDRRAG
jgi:Helix-turn-helix